MTTRAYCRNPQPVDCVVLNVVIENEHRTTCSDIRPTDVIDSQPANVCWSNAPARVVLSVLSP